MSSHLDLSLNSDDEISYAPSSSSSSSANRRGKRGAATAPAASTNGATSISGKRSSSTSSTTLQTANTIAAFPLLLFSHLMALFYKFASSILPEPIIRPIANLMNASSETDKLLDEMPAKQSKLQSDVGKVGKDQVKLKHDMDALKERIRKIEERRERWSKQAAEIDREKNE
eukprot:CAMPEP_0197716010 /NCGR_PEP_ID=MMETSP1434-20131217/1055_1 /TAXON_ID=265543 /ORGANISM="Minutocellus polymorphus, Strain CCMP3303" /LENGTH=171 /DNA_ID=CAMNT_0043300299 /DNA_START=151 /DNA_END=666 /DNA_ORIENTATION=-